MSARPDGRAPGQLRSVAYELGYQEWAAGSVLFSIARYEQVIDAYLTGLERRAQAGDPIDAIASVASFFVSRVDAKTDVLVPAGSNLHGRLAIANARLAYARYRNRFSDRRWLALREGNALLLLDPQANTL